MNMNTANTIQRFWSVSVAGLIVVFIVILDQFTKYLSTAYLPYAEVRHVFPGFDLLRVHNTGAAFSFLSEAGGWQRWILAGISLLVSVAIALWLWRLPRKQILLGLALSMILGGALGNLYDRVVMGFVVDFISVYVGQWRFATFNVADAAISTGAALLALDVILGRGKHDSE